MLPQDPMILLSYLNTKLRDFYPTLDALCDDLQIDGGEVSRKHPRPPIFSASKE